MNNPLDERSGVDTARPDELSDAEAICDGIEARRTAAYWKAEHLAGNAEIKRLRAALDFAAHTLHSDWPERCQEIVRRARAALASQPSPQGAGQPVADDWLDDAYERLCRSCKGAGEVPPTLPTFVRGLIGMLAPIEGAGQEALDARRDAARYRWLRQCEVDSYLACGKGEKLDAAIDSALQAEKASEHLR